MLGTRFDNERGGLARDIFESELKEEVVRIGVPIEAIKWGNAMSVSGDASFH